VGLRRGTTPLRMAGAGGQGTPHPPLSAFQPSNRTLGCREWEVDKGQEKKRFETA